MAGYMHPPRRAWMADMTGIVATRIISFVMLATCAALCQRPEHSNAANPLPDAPSVSVQRPTPNQSLDSACLAWAFGPARPSRDCHPRFDLTRSDYSEPLTQKESGDLFARYLSRPSAPLVSDRNRPSANDSLVGRATYAASSVFLTHDDSGTSRPNTSYLLRVLTSAVVHSAYRPYWKRSISQPFSEFGATIGNDAGMSVLHEFEPGILQLMKTHQPKFVSEIGEHFHRK